MCGGVRMAEIKKVKVVFQFRRATTEEWSLNEDEIPYAGEPCYDLDLGTLKIGNGVTPYRDLNVISGASISEDGFSLIVEDIKELQELVGEIPVADQIANAISGISYTIDESELQEILDSVLNN
jgi:hypothetical protein